MVFYSNRLEEIKGYGKVRRIKYGASIHGDNKDYLFFIYLLMKFSTKYIEYSCANSSIMDSLES